ncbi:MAG: hypothetical protein RR751_04955 [Clostridia bacterium]
MRMKKSFKSILSTIAALMLIIGINPFSAKTVHAEEHTHNLTQWYCTEGIENATCNDPVVRWGQCECGYVDYEVFEYYFAEHNMVSFSQPATCTQMGIEGSKCTFCGGCSMDTIYPAPLGHDVVSNVVSNATCTSNGVTANTCSRCGENFGEESTPALGHSYGSWYVSKEATQSSEGTETRTCSCGEAENRSIAALPGNVQEEVIQEAPKEEAPKQEAVIQEAPQQEEAKQEAPKQEAAAQEETKQETKQEEKAAEDVDKKEDKTNKKDVKEEAKKDTKVEAKKEAKSDVKKDVKEKAEESTTNVPLIATIALCVASLGGVYIYRYVSKKRNLKK